MLDTGASGRGVHFNAHKERVPRGEDNSLEGRQDFKRKFCAGSGRLSGLTKDMLNSHDGRSDFKRKSNARTHWLNVGA